jgi:hypothetical protein
MSDDLSSSYGAFYSEGLRLRSDAGESSDLRLEESKIPGELRPLIPYAEFWGISDDTFRIELVNAAPAGVWRDFRETVKRSEKALLGWLSGPEANKPPSQEYVAFSAMLQAFDWPRD